MKNLLSILTIILCVWLSFCCTDGARKRKSGEVSFHRIHASSLFPSSSCVLSPRAFNTKSSLQLVHRQGPCSSLSSKKAKTSPNQDDILRLDQARVKSIHSKLSKKLTDSEIESGKATAAVASLAYARDRDRPSQSTDLQTRRGSIISSGNYIVTDSSDMTWTQCEPCGGSGTCYLQEEPIFDPYSSSSYSSVSCSPPLCDSLTSQGFYRNCSTSNCVYGEQYGINSSTSGFLAKEKFTLNSDIFDNVNFGCGTVVDVGLRGTLFELDTSHVCLAFAGNDNDDDVAIFGNHQQRTLQIVYDRAGGRVGFAPNGCL
ncbi:hypothetical protein F2Q70_00006329 [Brassica cretica]|uniref:Xylanase inhibitor N-terminal domain-containing protein n=1 Tax=Brassica cretica TaxID=69181 RepID=A0A8S9ILR4_BRACR|nr:hypothetical protein F2Q70_00006329 [Brassica cretica]